MENIVFTQLSVQEVRAMLREEVRTALKDLQPQPAKEESNELMTIEEVANYIHMAVPSVYGLVHFRKIPHIKRGKRLIFEKQQITEWLHAGRQKTGAEISESADAYLRSKRNR